MNDESVEIEIERLRKRADRERRAREAAEAAAEQGTRLLYERQQRLQLLNAIADAANGASSVDEVVQNTLDQICAYTAWPVGHAYFVTEDPTHPLVPASLWHLDDAEQFAAFRHVTENKRFRCGEGLPGRVLESGAPVWVADVTQNHNFPRAQEAIEIGVRGAFAIPVNVGTSVAAVLEFFSLEPAEPEKDWLEVTAQVATQVGRTFERQRAREELEKMHQKLLEASRYAGMAEIATGVLHNVGNALNSVNVSALLISDRLRQSRIAHLASVVGLLRENAGNLGQFLTADPKGKNLPGFIDSLAQRLSVEQAELLREGEGLVRNIAHIKEIVDVQQIYARVSAVIEALPATELVEDALQMNGAAFERHGVEVVREFDPVPPVRVDRHKVLQILINLIRNAKQAASDSPRLDKRMTVRIGANGNNRVKIIVADNGVGIAPENFTRIFAHGFTTRKNGHGFGLHSAALAANEMGGSLGVHSDGPGCGATFTLELPMEHPSGG
jgi:signal transduction histidine kinase